MLFSSVPFLYCFLPLVLLVYYIVPKCLKNTVLLASSLIFYGWGEPKFLIFMLATIVQAYVAAIITEKFRGRAGAKAAVAVSAVMSLALLAYCKYADFFIENFNAVTGLSVPLLKLALPVGISFYTFQTLSYVIDVYRSDVPAQKNIIDLAMYVAMFPQLIAGPIVRYSDVVNEIKERTCTAEDFADGIRRFVAGLSKKILLANVMAQLVAEFKAAEEKTVLFCWMYAVAYMLHIYFDFSGYSDMAIGLGRMFGFKFPENFNYPYISRSITEFWRRWHISLGVWFRDYLYIPLGGNRVKPARHIFNILVVWIATGFWHGAEWNFILWGLMFALLLMLEKYVLHPERLNKIISHAYVLLFVMLSFVLFDSTSIPDALSCFKAMFGAGGLAGVNTVTLYYLRSYAVPLALGIIGSLPVAKRLYDKVGDLRHGAAALTVAEPVCITLLLAVCTAYLIDGSFNPFVYFRF